MKPTSLAESLKNKIPKFFVGFCIDAFFCVDSDSVTEILNNNPDVNQEAERGSDKFEYELNFNFISVTTTLYIAVQMSFCLTL
jgi:hypothetical protein